jgi:hypothetical protein
MNDITFGIGFLIFVGILVLAFSWFTGKDKDETMKNLFQTLALVALSLLILGAIGWVMFAGWRD